ncbi:hypothetical protein ACJMK2_034246 [Sinanodonta woodiana]|uniref:Uncharacterized protein n=1 Tax=Sinanodonta woodiana TaxID=1069815 RepID=A0ABD3WUG4_SINWO
MLLYMLVLGLVTLEYGEPCCVPDAMEGVAEMVFSTTMHGMLRLVKGRAMVHLNLTLGMMEIEAEISVNGHETNITVIYDYNQEIQYTIINGSCTKFVLNATIPKCIPENATLVEETFLGAGSEQVPVKTYTFMIANDDVYFTVTSSGCVPILMDLSLHLATKQAVGIEVVKFSGITMGVKDPSIFDIPSICQSLYLRCVFGIFAILMLLLNNLISRLMDVVSVPNHKGVGSNPNI